MIINRSLFAIENVKRPKMLIFDPQFDEKCKLGEGSYGQVFSVLANCDKEVQIKW